MWAKDSCDLGDDEIIAVTILIKQHLKKTYSIIRHRINQSV